MDPDWSGYTLQLDGGTWSKLELPMDKLAYRFGYKDSVGMGELLYSGGDVWCSAHYVGSSDRTWSTNFAHYNNARINPHTDAELRAANRQSSVDLADCRDDCETAGYGSSRILLIRLRIPPIGQDAVPKIASHEAAVRFDRCRRRPPKGDNEIANILRIECFRQAS